MTGKDFDWKKICKLYFGPYTQVHKYRNLNNTLEERTQGEICLGPTGNLEGTYNLFSIGSGKNNSHGQFTEVPTPTIVMKRVDTMASDRGKTKD